VDGTRDKELLWQETRPLVKRGPVLDGKHFHKQASQWANPPIYKPAWTGLGGKKITASSWLTHDGVQKEAAQRGGDSKKVLFEA